MSLGQWWTVWGWLRVCTIGDTPLDCFRATLLSDSESYPRVSAFITLRLRPRIRIRPRLRLRPRPRIRLCCRLSIGLRIHIRIRLRLPRLRLR